MFANDYLEACQHIEWLAPAKLNLFLHVNGQRDDGYHDLQTLFQILDYGDSLRFSKTSNHQIHLENPLRGCSRQDNLIYRAARALQEACAMTCGVSIRVTKRLPMGGGIGGGSSNAATTLLVLNKLWRCGLSIVELAEIGLKLGADVPVFIYGQSGFAHGVGQHIEPFSLKPVYYLVIHPGEHISTAEIFNEPNLPRNTPLMKWGDYSFESTHNDCQQLVVNRYPKVANLLQHLIKYAPSRLTGTGSCVFSIFNTEDEAVQVTQTLRREGIIDNTTTVFISRGVNHSPIHKMLDSI